MVYGIPAIGTNDCEYAAYNALLTQTNEIDFAAYNAMLAQTDKTDFSAYEKALADLQAGEEKNNADASILAQSGPSELRMQPEVQYSLGKILNSDLETSKPIVVQRDLINLMADLEETGVPTATVPPKGSNSDVERALADLETVETNKVEASLASSEPPESREVQHSPDKNLNSDLETPKPIVVQSDLIDRQEDVAKSNNSTATASLKGNNSDVESALADLSELEKATDEKPAEKQEVVSHEEPKNETLPEQVVVVEKSVSEKPAKQEEKISLLADLLAEVEAGKNNAVKPKEVNKFDARADEAVKGIGDAIISPFRALSGIKDVAMGEFSDGQKEIRNAVVDFANAPAQAVNFVTTAVEASVNDLGSEKTGKIISAPLKVVSGIWETGVSIVKPEEGSIKKAFDKMTFGLFN